MRAVQVALALGLAILLPLLAEMTVRFWAEPPKSEDYYNYYDAQPKTAAERSHAEATMRAKQDSFQKADAAFNLKLFYVAFPLGIVEVLAGFLLRRKATLASGLVFGGLSTVGCGSYSSWETLPGWARYASLLFALLFIGGLALTFDRQSLPPRSELGSP